MEEFEFVIDGYECHDRHNHSHLLNRDNNNCYHYGRCIYCIMEKKIMLEEEFISLDLDAACEHAVDIVKLGFMDENDGIEFNVPPLSHNGITLIEKKQCYILLNGFKQLYKLSRHLAKYVKKYETNEAILK